MPDVRRMRIFPPRIPPLTVPLRNASGVLTLRMSTGLVPRRGFPLQRQPRGSAVTPEISILNPGREQG